MKYVLQPDQEAEISNWENDGGAALPVPDVNLECSRGGGSAPSPGRTVQREGFRPTAPRSYRRLG